MHALPEGLTAVVFLRLSGDGVTILNPSLEGGGHLCNPLQMLAGRVLGLLELLEFVFVVIDPGLGGKLVTSTRSSGQSRGRWGHL